MSRALFPAVLLFQGGRLCCFLVDCPEIRYLFKEFEILDFTRIQPMVQKYTPGKQFGELLIGNYDLLEWERNVPLQMSMNEMLGKSTPVE